MLVSVEELSADSCPAEIWVTDLKTILAREAKLRGRVKNIKFPSGNYQTDSSQTKTR